jgi:hypothetical protein
MEPNTDPGRFEAEGYCLLRHPDPTAIPKGLGEDILAAIAAFKETPGHLANPERFNREYSRNFHLAFPRVADFVRSPVYADAVSRVYGGEADLFFTSTVTKTAERGAHVDWHQDSAYDPEPQAAKCLLWISVTASTRENGCLRILPGSHRNGPLPHGVSRSFCYDKEIAGVDESQSVELEMGPGDAILLHRHMAHASGPYRSGGTRIALIAGFIPPKAEYTEFERKGGFRYLRDGRLVWSRLADPA